MDSLSQAQINPLFPFYMARTRFTTGGFIFLAIRYPQTMHFISPPRSASSSVGISAPQRTHSYTMPFVVLLTLVPLFTKTARYLLNISTQQKNKGSDKLDQALA